MLNEDRDRTRAEKYHESNGNFAISLCCFVTFHGITTIRKSQPLNASHACVWVWKLQFTYLIFIVHEVNTIRQMKHNEMHSWCVAGWLTGWLIRWINAIVSDEQKNRSWNWSRQVQSISVISTGNTRHPHKTTTVENYDEAGAQWYQIGATSKYYEPQMCDDIHKIADKLTIQVFCQLWSGRHDCTAFTNQQNKTKNKTDDKNTARLMADALVMMLNRRLGSSFTYFIILMHSTFLCFVVVVFSVSFFLWLFVLNSYFLLPLLLLSSSWGTHTLTQIECVSVSRSHCVHFTKCCSLSYPRRTLLLFRISNKIKTQIIHIAYDIYPSSRKTCTTQYLYGMWINILILQMEIITMKIT